MSELNDLVTSQQDPPLSLAENVFAVFVSTFAGTVGYVAGWIVTVLLAAFAKKFGLLTDEGGSWLGLSLVPPIGGVCAGLTFVYCFIRVRRYLQK
jgi:hypothetical protein